MPTPTSLWNSRLICSNESQFLALKKSITQGPLLKLQLSLKIVSTIDFCYKDKIMHSFMWKGVSIFLSFNDFCHLCQITNICP